MVEKGLVEEEGTDRHNWRKKIYNKWAQEDVNRLYSRLNNNNNPVSLCFSCAAHIYTDLQVSVYVA
jgi:hypothetical protein